MVFDPQLISPYFEPISLSIGAATLILIVVLAGCILRRQTQTTKILDDLERRSRILSRLETEVRELKTTQAMPPVRPDYSFSQSPVKLPPDSNLEKKHRVVSLAQKGLNSEDIARQLNIYRGEAELVLSLSRYFKQSSQEDRDGLVQ